MTALSNRTMSLHAVLVAVCRLAVLFVLLALPVRAGAAPQSRYVFRASDWADALYEPGLYEIGTDIPAGEWIVRAAPGDYSMVSYGNAMLLDTNPPTGPYEVRYDWCAVSSPSDSTFRSGLNSTQSSVRLIEGDYVEISLGSIFLLPPDALDPLFSSGWISTLGDDPFSYEDTVRFFHQSSGSTGVISGQILATLPTEAGWGIVLCTHNSYQGYTDPVCVIFLDGMPSEFTPFVGDYVDVFCTIASTQSSRANTEESGESIPTAFGWKIMLVDEQ